MREQTKMLESYEPSGRMAHIRFEM